MRASANSRAPRLILAVATALLLAAVVVPSASAAKAFDPENWVIKMNKSIGGLKLGMNAKQAKSAWNGSAKCGPLSNGVQYCQWKGTDPEGSATYTLTNGKVVTVSIICGVKNGGDSIKKPLTRLRTALGIHLGSKLAQVKHAYPGGQEITSTTSPSYVLFYRLNGGKTRLQFNAAGKLTSIVFANAITGI